MLNKTAFCPECNAKVTLKRAPRLGQTTVCKQCRTVLEVVDTSPLEFDWTYNDDLDDDFDKGYNNKEDDIVYLDQYDD